MLCACVHPHAIALYKSDHHPHTQGMALIVIATTNIMAEVLLDPATWHRTEVTTFPHTFRCKSAL